MTPVVAVALLAGLASVAAAALAYRGQRLAATLAARDRRDADAAARLAASATADAAIGVADVTGTHAVEAKRIDADVAVVKILVERQAAADAVAAQERQAAAMERQAAAVEREGCAREIARVREQLAVANATIANLATALDAARARITELEGRVSHPPLGLVGGSD